VTLMDSPARVSASTRWRRPTALAASAVVPVLVLFLSALIDHATVTGRAGLTRVMFGYPLDWLAQDQTRLDQPFPVKLSPGSPWENPTSVASGPLIFDVLVVYSVFLLAWFVGRAILRGLRTAMR
jgi:hypothetical protein